MITVVSASITLVVAVLFVTTLLGLRQAHPTDLALHRPTRRAALARRVVGLHVRRSAGPSHVAACDKAAR